MKRRGRNRAVVAVAREMLVTIYHILNHHGHYRNSTQARALAGLGLHT